MNGVLAHADSAEALLILLLAGHFLGDFLLQGGRTAAGRARAAFPARHVGIMIVAHIVTVIPFASWAVAGAVLGIGLLHGAVDAVKSRWPVRSPGRLALFLLDQFAHVAVVLLAWLLLREFAAVPPLRIPDAWLEPWLWTSVVLASFALNAAGGSAIVTGVLDGLAPGLEEAEDSGVAGSGRLIGILERTITLILVLFDQWAAVAFLVAAKSIARFDELKQRHFAEYYLVGTLTSLLVAVVIGIILDRLLV